MQSTPAAKNSFARRARQAEATRRVLAIGDHEIELELVLQLRQLRRDHIAARLSDDVADEKNAHGRLVLPVGGHSPSTARAAMQQDKGVAALADGTA